MLPWWGHFLCDSHAPAGDHRLFITWKNALVALGSGVYGRGMGVVKCGTGVLGKK